MQRDSMIHTVRYDMIEKWRNKDPFDFETSSSLLALIEQPPTLATSIQGATSRQRRRLAGIGSLTNHPHT